MNCKLCPVALVALSALAGGSLVALTQPEPKAPVKQDAPKIEPPVPDMAAWMAAMKPGPHHEFFRPWIGKWDTTTKISAMPGSPAMESKGHAEYSWLMEGRFLQEKVNGTMMGMPMQGFGVMGYDNFNKSFIGCWMDNFGTGMINTTGALDQTNKVLTMFGHMDEPTTGEHHKTVRFQTTIVDNDTHKMTIDEMQYGQPFTVVEITYKRVK